MTFTSVKLFAKLPSIPTILLFAIIAILSVVAFYTLFLPRHEVSSKAPKQTSHQFYRLGALSFFTSRWDFYQQAVSESVSGNFSFYLGKYFVVGLSGNDARRVFFENRSLNLTEGNSLNPQIPSPPQATKNGQKIMGNHEFHLYFFRRINRILSRDTFAESLPTIIQDTKYKLSSLGTSGITDPFESIYNLVFQITMRKVGCDDIANDETLLSKVLGLYDIAEKSYNPSAFIFPFALKVLTPAFWRQMFAGARLFFVFKRIVDQRKKTGVKGNDNLQYLMDEGDDMGKIIGFVIGALHGGILNSGVNAGWLLVYLAANPEWMAKARKEVAKTAAKHSQEKSTGLVDQLSSLPLEAWENEFPFLDMCLKETIRLHLHGALLRRNISETDIKIGEEIIPAGAFVTYALADVHNNPAVYSDPDKWDPSRHFPERAEGQKKLEYVGWGAGLHPCPGMRFAKLEMNVIASFFLATFDYELSDCEGNIVKDPPKLNMNALNAVKPAQRPYLRYQTREKVST